MKKRTLLLCLLFAALFVANANPVDQNRAKEIGAKFLTASVGMRASTADLTLAKTYRMGNGDAAFYVFSTLNGFVIVSAQDVATPILGYSDEGPFDVDNIPENMEWWLQDYANQIQYGMEVQNVDLEKTAKQWESVKTTGRLSENRNRDVIVQPLLGDIKWDQGQYYNNLCPEASAPLLGNHTYAGCVACAMSQIMRKWNHPVQGYGSHQLPPYNNPDNVLDFSQTTYAWDNMPVALTNVNGDLLDGITEDQITAVATLVFHAGVSVNTTYSTSGSSADVSNPEGALKNNFGYSDELEMEGLSFQEGGVAMWKAKLRSSLDHGYPVFYGGSSSSGAHAFVCDGYDSNDYFHINWGYSGNQNNYYAIGALNYGATGYNAQNYAIFNIHPSGTTTSHAVTLSQNNEHGTVSGNGTFTHGTSVTVHAEATTGGYYFCYWTEDGVIVSENADYTFNIKYNRNLEAVFLDGFPITVETSNETAGTVNGGGTYGYNASCTLTATPNSGYIFENWTKNNEIVSCNNPYTFSVTGAGQYVANFISCDGVYIGGNDDSRSNVYPSNVTRKYTVSQQIYTTAELGESGEISAISFYNVGFANYDYNLIYLTDVTRTLDIYLTATDKTSFDSNGDWIDVELANLVFSGEVTLEYGTWTTILLENTYYYDGTKNIALIVYDYTGSTDNKHEFKTFSTNTYTALYQVNDNAVDPTAMSGTGIRSNLKNQLIVSKGEHTGFYTISTSVTPTEAGSASGTGTYSSGAECTVIATPTSSDYVFRYWTKNGKIMSYNSTYTFTVTSNMTLVAVFAAPSTVSVTVNPVDGGSVTGAGEFTYGSTCTLIATPAEGYAFNKWSIGDETVSTDESYTFTVTEDVSMVAHFRAANMIVFDDNTVKSICVANWDTNKDGELSIQEAADVLDLSNKFRYNNQITSFNELRFFTGLTTIGWYFGNCSNLTSVILPESVTNIGSSAFASCSKLMSITIPCNVIEIAYSAFKGCTSLAYMISECVTPPSLGTDCFLNVSTDIPVFVPKGTIAAYKAASGWSMFTKIVSVKTSDWSTPTVNDAIYIDANYTLTADVTVADVYFASTDYTLTIPTGKTLTVTGSISTSQASQIVVEDGGQLICNNPVSATVMKNITAASNWGAGSYIANGWYFIATPIDGFAVSAIASGINNTDLFSYDEPSCYWWNAQSGPHTFTTLSRGQGYLYASRLERTLGIEGTMPAANTAFEFDLSYENLNDALKGFNLVGNPFTYNLSLESVKINGTTPITTYYYVENGTELTASSSPVKPGCGFMIQATGEGQRLVFDTGVNSKSKGGVAIRPSVIRIEAGNDSFMDCAFVQIGGGNTLRKLTINDHVPHISVAHEGRDYAAATIEKAHGEIPLNFVANENDSYTLSVMPEGMEMSYLHLIDSFTGTDIDLLSTPSYTFYGKTTDYASRFKLVFDAAGNNDVSDESFAFIRDGNIVIINSEASATLQIVDVTGRVIASHTGDAMNHVSTSGMPAGMYVLRLLSENGVKTQKITVAP